MNPYRNRHYQVSNKIKQAYKDIVKTRTINTTKIIGASQIVYTLYYPTKTKIDLGNYTSIHDKFFCDALVDLGIIEDDNIDHVKQITSVWGGYDKGNGRVDICVYNI